MKLPDTSALSILPEAAALFENYGIRPPLASFAAQMELKLRKNDHKNALGWHRQPIEALQRLMLLEIEEFKVADEFYPVERAREELVDIANFALILHDRLSLLDQNKCRHEQDK